MRALVALLLISASAAAEELRRDAKALLEASVTHNLRLGASGGLELEDGELVEDDGPAAGYSYRPNEEKFSGNVRIRKELVLRDARAKSARLLVSRGGDGLTVAINGKPIATKRERTVSGYWSVYPVPVNVLREGVNEIVLGGTGSVYIARAEDFAAGSLERPTHPKRSARSSDGGVSWNVDKLGPKGDIAGEYCVRLDLERPRAAGSLVSPVWDLGNLAGKPIAAPVESIRSLRIQVRGTAAVRYRTGSVPLESAKSWSPWQPLPADGAVPEPTGRYVQIACDFTRNDTLRSVVVAASVTRPAQDWTTSLKVLAADHPPIVRSSIPFAYEPFDHPRLKALRETHRLDEVVKGARDELDTILRLAAWSSKRWQKGHLKDIYPPWDALEILKPHADGTPVGGFCQQYNLVFLQACESLGIPGRAVSIGPDEHSNFARRGGHEVVELWSNPFQKWIYVDGNMAFYAVDSATGVPLSLRELRERQRLEIAGKPAPPTRIVNRPEASQPWTSLKEWPPFQELRLIPRSNFLAQKAPLPLNQGMRGWSWTGHHVWTDAESPASPIYSERVSQPRNWDWTLNRAHLTLEAQQQPGVVKVYVDSNTPGLESFVLVNEGKRTPVTEAFPFTLKAGRNRIEVLPRNIAGRDGIPGVIEIEQP